MGIIKKIKNYLNPEVNKEIYQRLSGLERQIVEIRFPDGVKIGSKAKAKGYGDKHVDCFINSRIYMKYSVPHIDIFIPTLSPPNRTIHAEDVYEI